MAEGLQRTVKNIEQILSALTSQGMSPNAAELTWDAKLWLNSLKAQIDELSDVFYPCEYCGNLSAYQQPLAAHRDKTCERKQQCRQNCSLIDKNVHRYRTEIKDIGTIESSSVFVSGLEAPSRWFDLQQSILSSSAEEEDDYHSFSTAKTRLSMDHARNVDSGKSAVNVSKVLKNTLTLKLRKMDITKPIEVTVHDLENADKSGWLFDNDDGKRKWCVLSDMVLCLFDSRSSCKTSSVLFMPTFAVREVNFQSLTDENSTRQVLNNDGPISANMFSLSLVSKTDGTKRTFTSITRREHNIWLDVMQKAVDTHFGSSDEGDEFDSEYEPSRPTIAPCTGRPSDGPNETHSEPSSAATGSGTLDGDVDEEMDEDDDSCNELPNPEMQMLLSRRRVSYVLATDHSFDITPAARKKSQDTLDPNLIKLFASSKPKNNKFNLSFGGRPSSIRVQKGRDKRSKVKLSDLNNYTLATYLRVMDTRKRLSKLWCVLHDNDIHIFKTKGSKESSVDSISIDESDIHVTDRHGFEFEIKNRNIEKVYLLVALDRYDFNRWLTEIKPDFVPDPGLVSVHHLPDTRLPLKDTAPEMEPDSKDQSDLNIKNNQKQTHSLNSLVASDASGSSKCSDVEEYDIGKSRSKKKLRSKHALKYTRSWDNNSKINGQGVYIGKGYFGARTEDNPRVNEIDQRNKVCLDGLNLEDSASKVFDQTDEIGAKSIENAVVVQWQKELVHLKKQQLLNELLSKKDELQRKIRSSNALKAPESGIDEGRFNSENTAIKNIAQLKQRRISTQLKLENFNKLNSFKQETKTFKLNKFITFANRNAPYSSDAHADDSDKVAETHVKQLTQKLDSLDDEIDRKTKRIQSIRKSSDELSSSAHDANSEKFCKWPCSPENYIQGETDVNKRWSNSSIKSDLKNFQKQMPSSALKPSFSESNLQAKTISRLSESGYESDSSSRRPRLSDGVTSGRHRAATVTCSEEGTIGKEKSRNRTANDTKTRPLSGVNPATIQQIEDFERMSKLMLSSKKRSM